MGGRGGDGGEVGFGFVVMRMKRLMLEVVVARAVLVVVVTAGLVVSF